MKSLSMKTFSSYTDTLIFAFETIDSSFYLFCTLVFKAKFIIVFIFSLFSISYVVFLQLVMCSSQTLVLSLFFSSTGISLRSDKWKVDINLLVYNDQKKISVQRIGIKFCGKTPIRHQCGTCDMMYERKGPESDGGPLLRLHLQQLEKLGLGRHWDGTV